MTLNQANGLRSIGKGERGFTLIELMIVVTIIAILAAIVYPNYQNYILKSRRSDGKTLLTGIAAREEQYFMDNKAYTNNLANLGYAVNGDGTVTSEQGFYKVQVATPDAVSFNLTALPQGHQTSDTDCGNLTLNEQQVKGQSGASTDCW